MRDELTTIVPFEPKHLEGFTLREQDAEVLKDLGGDMEYFAQLSATQGPAFTCFVGDEVMCVGGVRIIHQALGEGWVLTGPLVEKHPIYFHKGLLVYLDGVVEEYGLKRLQALVFDNNGTSKKWIERLGFRHEATMEKYSPSGVDAHIYVRFRGE